MNNQMTGSMTQKMIGAVPEMIGRLGRGQKQPINNNIEMYPENMQTEALFTKVNLRPNPFFSSVTLEVTSGQNKQVIVRMMNLEGQIIKLFGWYLLKGTNVTTINELNSLHNGEYVIDILDNGGDVLFSAQLKKA